MEGILPEKYQSIVVGKKGNSPKANKDDNCAAVVHCFCKPKIFQCRRFYRSCIKAVARRSPDTFSESFKKNADIKTCTGETTKE
jgi:hypothetical protein